MLSLSTPNGLSVAVPESLDEDPSPRFTLEEQAEARLYYDENGYVIFSGLIGDQVCNKLRSFWDAEIKPSRSFIYRQATARAERNVFNDNGWVMNPVLNLQSVDPRKYANFRRCAVEEVLSAPTLAAAFRSLLDEDPKIVQSMYFEGNSATWEHQDTYYLDSETIGRMAAAWIAIEDIHAEAGRFFICPGSHKIDLGIQNSTNNIGSAHQVYIDSVVDLMRKDNLEIRAPVLGIGDVLFWNAKTVHGSLDSRHSDHSRSSVTCHAIPAGDRFLQLQMRVLDLKVRPVQDVLIYSPKDLEFLRNRAILQLESTFPRQFYWLKKNAIRALSYRNSA